jgi:two-component system, LytTR family, sensor kinase
MEQVIPYNVLNQRKALSHLIFLMFSLLITVLFPMVGKFNEKIFSPGLFVMLFIQLEVFVFLGNRLFASVDFDRSPGEVTRVVIVRFLIFLAGCLFASMVIFILLKYAGFWSRDEDLSGIIYNFFHYEIRGWFKSTVTGLTIGAIIFIFLLWQSSLRREQKLREENLIFQNETLKSQVNPHFLFNSLNTISALIKSQPETAEKFINDLSAVYRYILENSQKDRVPLQTEIDFITGYFDLHRIRDDGKIKLTINADNAGKFGILPVSLQIIIENAIKHNMATRENPLMIHIGIEDQYIVVSNNLQKKATQLKSTGLGLKNLSERVKLSTGKVLVIEETASVFTVKIPLLS